MANFNKVILLGNLTRDVELRYSQGGLAIAKLGMAINRRTTGQDGEAKETTCFVDLTAFGKQAEVLNQYVGKGSPLFVEGRLEYSTWDDQEGQKRSKLAVVIENFQFVGAPRGAGGGGSGGDGGGGPRRPAGRPTKEPADNVDYGDIPF
ncbi:MAG TPA: single-stranded DNA-binding protein [Planctomycetota bacterium]|nr:single-stranded DNA-binding protein [Planctomycetota bacterium]